MAPYIWLEVPPNLDLIKPNLLKSLMPYDALKNRWVQKWARTGDPCMWFRTKTSWGGECEMEEHLDKGYWEKNITAE